MKTARHFDITEWADFARNLVSSEQGQEMNSHLKAGCSKCEKLHKLMTKLVGVCARESALEDSPACRSVSKGAGQSG